MAVYAPASMAQCSVCTKSVQQLGEKPAKALNSGIIYLMLAPFLIVGVIGYRDWSSDVCSSDLLDHDQLWPLGRRERLQRRDDLGLPSLSVGVLPYRAVRSNRHIQLPFGHVNPNRALEPHRQLPQGGSPDARPTLRIRARGPGNCSGSGQGSVRSGDPRSPTVSKTSGVSVCQPVRLRS